MIRRLEVNGARGPTPSTIRRSPTLPHRSGGNTTGGEAPWGNLRRPRAARPGLWLEADLELQRPHPVVVGDDGRAVGRLQAGVLPVLERHLGRDLVGVLQQVIVQAEPVVLVVARGGAGPNELGLRVEVVD